MAERKVRVHSITEKEYEAAAAFYREYRFWNPAMTPVRIPCGTEPVLVTPVREKVTCKRCLKRLRAEGKR